MLNKLQPKKRNIKKMATSATPAPKPIRVQRTVTDVETFDDVTLVKDVPFTPVTSVNEAMGVLGNNADKLLQIINSGLQSEIRAQNSDVYSGDWSTLNDDGSIGAPYTGTPVNKEAVNPLVRTLAATVFGYSPELPIEQKREIKEKALAMIKSTPAILEGLKKTSKAQAAQASAE